MRARSASAAVAECDLTTPVEADDSRLMSIVGGGLGGCLAGSLVSGISKSRGLSPGQDPVA